MRALLGLIVRIAIGAVVISLMLFIFSPVGDLVCGSTECTDIEGGFETRPWVLFGFVGIISVLASLFCLVALAVLGEWTISQGKTARYELGTWYGKRLLARRELAALENNGEPGNDYDIP